MIHLSWYKPKFQTRVSLTQALILPRFECGGIFYTNASNGLWKVLQRAHNSTVRFHFEIRKGIVSPHFMIILDSLDLIRRRSWNWWLSFVSSLPVTFVRFLANQHKTVVSLHAFPLSFIFPYLFKLLQIWFCS